MEPPQKKLKVEIDSAHEVKHNYAVEDIAPSDAVDSGPMEAAEEDYISIDYMQVGKDVNSIVLSFLPVEDIVGLFTVSRTFYKECKQALKKVTKHVVHWGSGIDKDLKLIDTAQRCGASLKHLNLAGRGITKPKFEIPLETLSRILKHSEKDVESLVLHTGDFSAHDMSELFQTVARMTELRSLKLHTCRHPPYFSYFSAPHNLRELVLYYVDSCFLFYVLDKCLHLEKLHLYQSGSVGDLFVQLMYYAAMFSPQTADGRYRYVCFPHIKDLLIDCPTDSANQVIDNGAALVDILPAFVGIEKLQLAHTVISRTVMLALPRFKYLRSIICSRVVRQGWRWSGYNSYIQPSVEEYHDTMTTAELSSTDIAGICRMYPNLRVLNIVCVKYDGAVIHEIRAFIKLEQLYLYESRCQSPTPEIYDLLNRELFPALKKITVVKPNISINVKWEDFCDKLDKERSDIVFEFAARSGVSTESLFNDFCK